jgi:DNA polymerase III subunit delta'
VTALIGHGEAEAAFRAALKQGRIHHAWLLTGPRGLGKASFAEAAALRMLAEAAGPPIDTAGLSVPPGHPIARLAAAGSHPDLRRLTRLPREGAKANELARSITVAQVRGLQAMFATTPSLSSARAVIIDAADDLERSGANALLKNLEEPPAGTVFFLISHAPGRLLPTIRSRCRLLRFAPLGADEMRRALAAAIPGGEEGELGALARAGKGSPGQALRFAGLRIGELDGLADQLLTRGDPANTIRSRLAVMLGTKPAQERYEAFLERAPAQLASAARNRSGAALAETLALWEKARALADSARALSLDPQAVVFELAGLLASAALDPRPDHG